MSLTNDDWRKWLNSFEIHQKMVRDKKLVTWCDAINAEIALPDTLTEEGDQLADEISKEAARALEGFAKGRRWPV